MAGLIHIYCGDGKGKTTAAVGLAVRASGAGKQVLFTQFFKDGRSSEVKSLQEINGIKTVHCRKKYGLFFRMSEEERELARQDYTALMEQVLRQSKNADLLILDEVISACNHEIVPEGRLLEFLQRKPQELEVVMTGRNPSDKLLERADYVTEMKKIKHPFDKGVHSRKGIEF